MAGLSRRRILVSASAAFLASPVATLARYVGLDIPRLMQGPMIGAAYESDINIWARASGPYSLRVEYATDPNFSQSTLSKPISVNKSDDFTAKLKITGLKAASRYYYRVLLDDQPDKYQPDAYEFWTAPNPNTQFRLTFGSCARIHVDPNQRIFDAITGSNPSLFLWLGDNIYANSGLPSIIAEEYRRQRDVPSLQPLQRSVPQLAIWDDNDFGENDGGQSFPGKAASLEIFRQYWANPHFGLPDVPGVFFSYEYGGIDFFFLDGRYYRDENAIPDGPGKTMLGAAQKGWLKESLLLSNAPFKVLVSGGGWSAGKGPTGDGWSAFITERNEIFDFIRDKEIPGVFCLSGDSHVGELNCIPRSTVGGYDIYDFVSSPLAQPPSKTYIDKAPEIRVRPVYFRGTNFGVLDFEPGDDPTVTMTLCDTRGNTVWKPFRLRASDLINGKSTWRDMTDDSAN